MLCIGFVMWLGGGGVDVGWGCYVYIWRGGVVRVW